MPTKEQINELEKRAYMDRMVADMSRNVPTMSLDQCRMTVDMAMHAADEAERLVIQIAERADDFLKVPIMTLAMHMLRERAEVAMKFLEDKVSSMGKPEHEPDKCKCPACALRAKLERGEDFSAEDLDTLLGVLIGDKP